MSTSLPLASRLTSLANDAFESGELYERVTPTTRELLIYWFDSAYMDERGVNFHVGQRQAILNAIYAHEILGVTSVRDMYMRVDPTLILEDDV